MSAAVAKPKYMQNRELSWLKFNERVLMEAMDEQNPLLERLKFISIFNSNLDEFFMIRVGSLFDLLEIDANKIDNRSGFTVTEQLQHIYETVAPLYQKKDFIYADLRQKLMGNGIYSLQYSELKEAEKQLVKEYFHNHVLPVLSPQIVDTHHPFPHIQNNVVYLAAMIQKKDKSKLALIQKPAALSNLLFLPGEELRYIRLEDIMLRFMEEVYQGYEIIEKTKIRVTRNADINFDDEVFEVDADFRSMMKQMLHKRKRLAAVRLETSSEMSKKFEAYLCEKLSLQPSQIFMTKSPLELSEAFSLGSKLPKEKGQELSFSEFAPRIPSEVNMKESIIKQVEANDILLSYPFESMKPFLQLIKEAAYDPSVVSIKITIYRLASKTKLVEYLCAAAENGKDVTVLIELRARFDEQNNIDWSETLEEAGCNIVYGFDGYKVHSKICLITKKDKNDFKYITQIGTGNYNEKTAKLYTDISLMTYCQEIGRDANEFFRNMCIGNLEGHYHHLLVAPNSFKSRLMEMIDAEIEKGEDGYIFLKINSMTDVDLIEKLREASCAGVTVRMIIRGICCILPDVKGETEHVKITNIVGRYLEHSRIYAFGKGDNCKIYLGSADFMTRNTERRVEVGCPVYAPHIQKKIFKIMELCGQDNVKSRRMLFNGEYIQVSQGEDPVNAQEVLMHTDIGEKGEQKVAIEKTTVMDKIIKFFIKE
ncbi:polyphosphate kinase 1 [Chakrabartyella piscis]|uniref:polyphosphate kinase 1 n=1 Tax=Chakrabartyella piscis TaxID=2918914 RepID=UPI0029583616|nr:polyphosphate kinase 1 [Chakrabartyella piscis]